MILSFASVFYYFFFCGGDAKTRLKATIIHHPPWRKLGVSAPQQRIVHITTSSNRIRDLTPGSVCPLNGTTKSSWELVNTDISFRVIVIRSFSERQLRTNIAQTVRRLLIAFLAHSTAHGVDESIPASAIVFDLLALYYGRFATGAEAANFRHGGGVGVGTQPPPRGEGSGAWL